jgi:ectoine hydroxylase-related dioxygenase (phytanoyl-CoA dioxygenase family)
MTTPQAILEHLDIVGYCVIEAVIPPTEVPAVRQSLSACLQADSAAAEERMAAIRAKGHRIGGSGVQALPGIINLDQSFVPYLMDERINGVLNALFGPHHRISNTGAIANHPGNDRGYWHADWPYNQTNAAHIPAPYADAVGKLSSIWMLTEFTPQTGGTLVLPGSHRAQTNPSGGNGFDREAPHPSELQISAAAGSVMLFDSRLWHCVAANHSTELE